MNRPRPQDVGPDSIPDPSGAATMTHAKAGPGSALRARARWLLGAVLLVALVARLGTGPFVSGVRLTTVSSLLAAVALTALTTVCCAWRWRLVADGLGVRIGLGAATAAVYRAQFLNATLPGGVLGDVDRAVPHARRGGALGPGVRSVVWERTLGQVVQVVLTVGALLLLPSALRSVGVTAGAGLLAAGGIGLLLVGVARRHATRAVRLTAADLRAVLRTRRRSLAVVALTALAVVGHLLVFLLAARVAGVPVTALEVVPLAAVVLLAAAVPANVAGWGPREGMAAWAFGAAGLGVDTGVTTAVVYGVMALVATLPGAVVLLAGRATRRTTRPRALALPAPLLQEAARA